MKTADSCRCSRPSASACRSSVAATVSANVSIKCCDVVLFVRVVWTRQHFEPPVLEIAPVSANGNVLASGDLRGSLLGCLMDTYMDFYDTVRAQFINLNFMIFFFFFFSGPKLGCLIPLISTGFSSLWLLWFVSTVGLRLESRWGRSWPPSEVLLSSKRLHNLAGASRRCSCCYRSTAKC